MCRLCCERQSKTGPAPSDLPGKRISIDLPDVPENVKSWEDFLKWILDNPEIILAIITMIMQLLGGLAPPPKRG